MTVVLNPNTLPVKDNIEGNPYAYSIALDQPWFLSKGAMIAYYGDMRFQSLRGRGLSQPLAVMVSQRFSSPLYLQDWVVAEGRGNLVVGDRGFDINSYDLDVGNLTIRASNLLAFQTGLELKQSIVPGFVTLIGTGTFLASSNGPVMFAEPPLRIDPEALVGWADCPSPSHHFDAGWMQGFMGAAQGFMGVVSGEERQFDFTGAGTVLIQSSEAVRDDRTVLQNIESQLGTVGPGGLQQLQASIQARLAQNQM
ncbi:MAG TPA: AIM24 family protein [Mycobacteriales bacterium]|nr:AIM24 family protein [Mycobacteriales bacterium]